MTDRTSQPIALLSPIRLVLALFFVAFGFSLLSVCLFRALTFTPASVAFFVFYLCVGMPLGAMLARWKSRPTWMVFGRAIRALLWLSAAFPFLAWLAAHGPDAAMSILYWHGDTSGIWLMLAWQSLVCAPLFVLWGYAEFSGYEVALDSPKVKGGFYLIFVWALGCAFAVGYYSIPWLGWLRTLMIIPCCALAAMVCWDGELLKAKAKKLLVIGLSLALCWVLAGHWEQGFQFLLFSDKPFHARNPTLTQGGGNGLQAPPLGRDAVVESVWGKYCHVALIRHDDMGGKVAGCYDGLFHWFAHPKKDPPKNLESLAFSLIPQNSQVCVLGAGGGADVVQVLARNPKQVVAVDLIPEVFEFFREKHARENGGIYLDSRVTTMCAEGRRYVENAGKQFDVIIMPHTESLAAASKALFDPGQRIHTTEGFASMKKGLRPGGFLLITKTLDKDAALYNGYAASLVDAGFGVSGIHGPAPFGLEGFILVASEDGKIPLLPPDLVAMAKRYGGKVRDFSKNPPMVSPITDDSPWITGIMGTAFSSDMLSKGFWILAWVGGLGILACLGFSFRGRKAGQSLWFRGGLTLAGVMIGANAVLLENGVIFWFIKNLMNPMAAFVVGASLFLLIWGLSSLALKSRGLVIAVAGLGLLGLLLLGGAKGNAGLMCLGGMALGSGLAFPFIALRHPADLMHLFVADMVGGMLGGLLGIWIPVLMGTKVFFQVLPGVWILTMVLVWFTLRMGKRTS